jgi:two-component system, OmpR family, alkaline phosphatase synthesis response regulator PhoP
LVEEKINDLGTMKLNSQTLTRTQRTLLEFLAAHPAETVTREELSHHVWRQRFFAPSRTIDQTVANLRKKLGDGCITAVRSVGYRFEPRQPRM